MATGIIDRFEGEFALVEIDGEIKQLPRTLFPPEATEGDVVIIEQGRITVDIKSTAVRKKKIKKLMNNIWED